jgi:hypothetical protein
MLATIALGQSPAGVQEALAAAADALANARAEEFLRIFDPQMAGYAALATHIHALTAAGGVASTIEIRREEAGPGERRLEVDWQLQPRGAARRRATVTLIWERQGGSWRIRRLEPLDFFAFDVRDQR